MNPYNISKPAEGEMFVGRSDVLEEIIDRGLKDSGMPSIVVGGRRLGKTSLLFRIVSLLRKSPYASDATWIIPAYLDFKKITPLNSPDKFWRALVDNTVQTLRKNMPYLDLKNVEAQISQDDANNFDRFTSHLNTLMETIIPRLGKVRIVFLIDEMEEMLGQEWTDSALGHLRWLHYSSPMRGSVSFVLTGFKDLHTYKEKVGSPLTNIALTQTLSVLSYEESIELMTKPLKVPPTQTIQNEIYRQSGGHPFLIQYLMWRICHNNPVVATKDDVEEAIDIFHRQRDDFQNWWGSLSEMEQKVYALLARDEHGMLKEDICAKLGIEKKKAGDALNFLCYLGIAKQEQNHFCVSSLMFRDWAEEEGLLEGDPSPVGENKTAYTEQLPPFLVNELKKGNVVLFIGAGLSMGAGLPSWKELVEPLADEIGCPKDDLLKIAQYYVQHHSSRVPLYQHLRKKIKIQDAILTENHRLLIQLPVRVMFTTNYDELLEDALREARILFHRIILDRGIGSWNEAEEVQLVKLHGSIDDEETIVITEDDYRTYFQKHQAMHRQLESLLMTKTFLFVGYSLNDANFNFVYDEIQTYLDRERRPAYAIMFNVNEFVVNDYHSRGLQIINITVEQGEDYSAALQNVLKALVEVLEGT